ncbi:MAG: 3D domain-containing protein [Firmicutes bacterium]|nr:3D domain-containing protein [Bacillota bacterium]
MLRKRSYRLASKNRKHIKLIMLTVLFGALSLVGALSYSSASEANQKYIESENNKMKLLEEQFNVAKNTEEKVILEDIKAKETAEKAAEAEKIAKQKAAQDAARLEIEKAQMNILAKNTTTAKISTTTPIKTPTKTITTTTPTKPATSTMKYLGALSSTAYTSTGNNMANGELPYEGAVACNLVPLGTKIYIEGYGYFVVKDRIGHSSQLDIFMDTYDECIQFGRRTVKVYVVN